MDFSHAPLCAGDEAGMMEEAHTRIPSASSVVRRLTGAVDAKGMDL
jgi:hypothetical protein